MIMPEDEVLGRSVPADTDRDKDEAPAGETYQQRVNKQMRREIEEADQDWVRKQKLLDYLWEQRLLESAPDDMYEVGGFIEYHSKTPSFHKAKRDRDWRVR